MTLVEPKTMHGFPVIAFHHTPKQPATREGFVVLVQRSGDHLHPFVTGWVGMDDNVLDREWSWGHYFKTEGEARQDYNHRCRRGY